ncbi:DUF4872 domain-containing protein [Paenibacillus crassostreae]|uniref:DUF4872 domain-containing protein n=1 Tax=Paenibacillus crassostreae TaxID=1763538 RepID=A0A167FB40_9BACL|nr:DUF4872 domain-containing protein [Paenibacillus crassostreae]AOZ90862.1 hypothetical protein LPB68_00670 [Paenibacillus crassostreae]OAB76372.1 hypothetical protein PNBC_02865 [Paenibacillus crassostreae]
MDRSLHPSCLIATFSNTMRIQNKFSIHDDLLFGLSRSFDFQYDMTKLPLSGETHTFWGTNLDAYIKLATALKFKYIVVSVDENNFMDELKLRLATHGSVVVEVSIKEYLDIIFQTDLNEFFDVVMESNTNHTINVTRIDDEVHFLDNYSLNPLTMDIDQFMKSVFPKDEAIIPSRGRIHCFDVTSIDQEVGKTKLLECIRSNMQTFLYSTNTYTGMRALRRFHKEIELMFKEDDIDKRKRNIYMFQLSCSKAGSGSFYRINYLRFLKKIRTSFSNSEELDKVQNIYSELHHMWKKFNVLIKGLLEEQNINNELYYQDIENHLESIIQSEKLGSELLLEFSLRNMELLQFSNEESDLSWEFTNVNCALYFEKMNLDYQFKFTNVLSDVKNDYVHYKNKAEVFMVDYELEKLVPYDDDYDSNHDNQQTYHYFIVHALEAG